MHINMFLPATNGIVPGPGDNLGIVPPWLQTPPTPGPGRNPGIVPPWLQVPGDVAPIGPTEPVGPEVPQIFGGAATQFDPTPVDIDQPRFRVAN